MPAGASELGGGGAAFGRLLALALLAAVAVLAGDAAVAGAAILPPSVIDGPSTDGLSLGDVAMAPDGTGGLVYTKTVEGRPHVFVSRYTGVSWEAPIRVDRQPYEASEPRIAAGDHGRLMVVWVAPVATLAGGELRQALYSASIGPAAESFGKALIVDPNVKAGAGTSPSLAGVVPGQAIVAYRVVTHTFDNPLEFSSVVQLRPGDVVADIRVARLEGDRWSRLGAINRNPSVSMRPPSETNGPLVAIGQTGRAAVAWQEPDGNGTAQVLARRVTGTTLGPIFAASPETFEGQPVTDEASALGLAVTPFDRVRVAARIDGEASSPLLGQRIFLTSFGSSSSPAGGKPTTPEPADGPPGVAPAGPVGPPALAAADSGGTEGSLDLAFTSGTTLFSVGDNAQGKLQAPTAVPGPPALPGAGAVVTIDPEGGGVTAYPAEGEAGQPTVAVDQQLPEEGFQSATLYGPVGGTISQLSGEGSGVGDALIAFRQGESGRLAIVADRVTAPPQGFAVIAPKGWVGAAKAVVHWQPPVSAAGGLTYSLLVDGRQVVSNLKQPSAIPPASLISDGVSEVQALATDRFGDETVSRPAKIRIDSEPPAFRIRVGRASGKVALRLSDDESGLVKRSIRVDFGDGTRFRDRAVTRHRYLRGGKHTITVRARDRVGNVLDQRLPVTVR